jgi:hypothetical protein
VVGSLSRPRPKLPPPLLGKDDLVPDAALGENDIDQFDHQAIAQRVAELSCAARPPINIALFGAWGSGKSSVFWTLKDQVKQRDPKAEVVRYDAWKYGGQSLKRNFITSVAKSLNYSERDFTEALSEGQERSHLDLAGWIKRNKPSLALGTALAFGGTGLWLLIVAFLTMHVDEIAFRQAVGDNLGRAGTVLSVALAGLLLGPKLLESATVKTSRVAPHSDDHFADEFKKLVDKATDGHKHRLVVFIDELDRCAPEDVVSTLIDLKTFLDEPGCVFIVAADREVLEQALQKVPQGKPVREDEPYYSTPGAFLDKIFQHQVSLPPLRTQALSRFARTLVADAGGLWAELRAADDGGQLFEDVVYTLVPAHVRSPRRVKVLLNNYATGMRVAQARGLPHLERATEIAKLTVLQTEFPTLAGDLLATPRLPALLLDPPDDPSPELARQLRKYGAIKQRPTSAGDGTPGGAAGELLVDDRSDKPAAERADKRLNDELRAYLRRTAAAGVPDPRPDLLYLQGAGAAEGLSDPRLGEVIDFAGENPPADTAAHFVGKSSRDVQIAASLMARKSDAEFGPAKGFLVEAACLLAEQLSPSDLAPIAAAMAPSVSVVAAGRGLTHGMLPGGLAVAAQAGDVALADRLTDLLANADDQRAELLTRVAPVLAELSDAQAERLEHLLAERYLDDPQPLHHSLQHLPGAAAVRLWNTAEPSISQALTDLAGAAEPEPAAAAAAAPARARSAAATPAPEPEFEDDAERETAAERYEELLTALDQRSDPEPQLLSRALLLGQSSDLDLHAVVRRRAEQIMPLLHDAHQRRRHVLLGLTAGPTQDWLFWAEHLEPARTAEDRQAGRAAVRLLRALGTVDLSVADHIPDVLSRLAHSVSASEAPALLAAARAALDATGWDSESSEQRRLLLYTALAPFSEQLGAAGMELMSTDLFEGIAENDHDDSFIGHAMRAVDTMPPEAARLLTEQLQGRTPAAGEAAGELRVLVGAMARHGGSAPAPATIAVAAGEESAQTLVSEWLTLHPSTTDALAAIADLGWPAESALRSYADMLDRDERTVLWVGLNKAGAPPRLLAAAGASGVGPAAVELVRQQVAAPRQDERNDAVRRLLTVKLDAPDVQPMACELALHLLSTEIAGDATLAGEIAIQAGGAAHGYTGRLREALQRAEDRNDKIFKRSTKEQLAVLTLLRPPKKKGFFDRVLGG